MILKRLEFEDVSHLAETMIAMLGDVDDDYPVITAYGNYDVIKELLEELIADGFGIVGSICLEDIDSSGYDKEFVLYLTEDGVSTYKIFNGERYLNETSDIAFVHEECNSKILDYIESKFVYEFGYEEDEDDEYDCANCDLDDCIRCGCGELESKDGDSESDNKDAYTITVKCHLDTDEAEKIISDMKRDVEQMHSMFVEMDAFRRMFRW